MALVGNVLLGTGSAPGLSSIASAYAESAASSRIPWGALEYSGETITAISGSAIGGQGGTDSATVSAIASAYAESAASGKLDNSASSTFQPSGDYAYASSLSSYLPGSASSQFAPSGDYAFNSSLSSKLDESASSMFQPSGNYQTAGDYAFNSSVSSKLDASASSQFAPSGNYQTAGDYAYNSSLSSKVDQSAFDNCCSSMSSVVSSLETSVTSMSSVVSGLTGDYLEKSASSMFQPSGDYQTAGDYAYNSSVSSKLDASASSQFAPSGDYADKSALSSYVPVSASGQFALSGDYAYNSALSGKLDASASSQFQPSGNYQDRSSISAWTGDMSSISAKLDQSAFTSYSSTVNNNISSIENNITAISSVVSGKADASAVHTYTGIDPIVVDNDNDQISLSASAIHFDSTMRSYVSGGSGFVGVNGNYLSGVAHDTSLSGDGSEAYPLGVSNYAGQYTSPSATIEIDNVNGTLEATRYAVRHLPALNLTGTLVKSYGTATSLDTPSFLNGRSSTLIFTDISGATQFRVSGAEIDNTAVYRYIGIGTSITIPSSISDMLIISGNEYTWSAKVRISASAEDRVDPLLYFSDMRVGSLTLNATGYPCIKAINSWPISAAISESARSAYSASFCSQADSSYSAGSAHKAVSAQAALKYFTGGNSSDTAYISSLKITDNATWQSLTAWAAAQGWTP